MKRLFQIVGLVVLLVVGLGAFLYFTDYAVGATISGDGHDDGGAFVVATTKLGGYDVKEHLSETSYTLLHTRCFSVAKPEGGLCTVTWNVQTHHIKVFANADEQKSGAQPLYER